MNNENNKTYENNNSGNHNEGRRMKNMLNSKLEYYYGFGMGRYGEVLNELFVHGNVNSCWTSSIPLAEFWQPDNLGRITQVLRPYLSRFDAEKALKFFEFPTDPEADGKRIGRPSMTDLMLMDGEYQIALEAKYTEYSRMTSSFAPHFPTRISAGIAGATRRLRVRTSKRNGSRGTSTAIASSPTRTSSRATATREP